MTGVTAADRYLVVPAHVVRHALTVAADRVEALQAAVALVEKDRIPRAIVRLVSEVKPSDKSQVFVVAHAEVAHGISA